MEDMVKGFCPMGCGDTLTCDTDGTILCLNEECPDDLSVTKLIAEIDTRHVARITEDNFTLQHPLRERLDGALFDCDLHSRVAALDGPPVAPGFYFCWLEEGEVQWEPTQPPA